LQTYMQITINWTNDKADVNMEEKWNNKRPTGLLIVMIWWTKFRCLLFEMIY
jgi:hypothetical protein